MTMIDRRGFLFGALTVIAAGAGEFRLGFAQAAAKGEAPGGVGEIGTPPIAPALANAWHAATGARLAALPLDFSGKA